ncbi:right-handed parallel beta-helix repeat-containing protein [Planctomycetota bacterium]
MKKTILPGLVLLLIAATQSSAETRSVPADYGTIQLAINASTHGDVVVVAPGTYVENINFLGKNITVTGTDPDDPEIVATTVIDGNGQGSVVTFESGERQEAVLCGFTITGGNGTVDTTIPEAGYIYWGSGIYCLMSSPTIKNNVISNNHGPATIEGNTPTALGYGGGIATVMADPIITNNVIKDNSAYAGGGIMTYLGEATVSNNLIYDNSGYVGGGALLLITGRLMNNTIVDNDASLPIVPGAIGIAGNVYIETNPDFGQCTLANNIICNAKSGGGLLIVGFGGEIIAFNDVWGNALGNYGTQDLQTGEVSFDGPLDRTGQDGNISDDPLFVDPLNHDYHLQTGSPCISAGDPGYVPGPDETDMDGEPRIYAARVDIGAYEHIGYVRPVAYAGLDQHVAELQLVTLDGSGSFVSDPCGVVFYEWDQQEGPAVDLDNPTSMHPTFMPEVEGEYQFELIVIDGEHFSEPDSVMVLVGNEPPVADAGPDKVVPIEGGVNLDGTGSYDPDAIDELTYTWSQLEGPQVVLQNADSATPSFESDQEGLYVFQLVVSDGFVDSGPSVVRVTTTNVTLYQRDLDAGYETADNFFYPDVSGGRVVYSVGSFDNYGWNIKSKDIETGEIDEEFPGGGIDTQPKIDGDIVVWAGGPDTGGFFGPENLGIFVRNLATGAEKTLRLYSDTESFSHPAVSGKRIVWLEHLNINKFNENNWRNTPYNIAGADISDPDQPVYFTIATYVGRRDPYPYNTYNADFDDVIDICDNRVVWEAGGDIYGADISNIHDIRVFTICSDPARQFDPAISGDFVVWTDERNDEGDIYGADISDPENIREMVIVKAPGGQQQPAIDGALIVYISGGNSGGQIMASALTKQLGVMDIPLSTAPFGVGPAIDGDVVVWQTGTYGQAVGMSLEFAYSVIDGPVENLNTGRSYDYIQHAIVSGGFDDRIVVSEGVYHEDIDFKGRTLTVSSSNPDDPAVVAATVIRGSGRSVTFSQGEGAESILSGFTITGASKGIYCANNAQPGIFRCTITGNSHAGIELYRGGNPTITDCHIVANARDGIEMRGYKSGRNVIDNYPTIRNGLIAANGRHGISGGVPTITNCTIAHNLLDGIREAAVTITNSIIFYNGDGSQAAQILDSTGTVTYSDVQGAWPGLGNIDDDPRFANSDKSDYHLKSQAGRWDPGSQTWVKDDLSSPCIDRGDPGSLPGDESAPNGGVINMGAYGGTDEASRTP